MSAHGRFAGLLALLVLLSACGEGGGAPSAVPPLASARVTSPFGMRDHHPIRRDSGPVHHDGYDLAAAAGSPIFAARDGKVTFAGNRGGYGLTVEIDHAAGLSTRYAHASKLAVRKGQAVQAGEILGFVGSTGLSTGPHLHYEVRLHGKPIDPRDAGFALASKIGTCRPAKARLAGYGTIEAAPKSVGGRHGDRTYSKRAAKGPKTAKGPTTAKAPKKAKASTTAKAPKKAKASTTARAPGIKAAAGGGPSFVPAPRTAETTTKAKVAKKTGAAGKAARVKIESRSGKPPAVGADKPRTPERVAELRLKNRSPRNTN